MRILLTGGCGYVGKALTRRFLPMHEVDLNRHGDPPFSSAELRSLKLIQGDIRNFGAIRDLIEDFDPQIVVHLAAIHYIPECEAAPDEAFATNTLGTANVVRACRPGTRFVFASTAAVYAPAETPHTEDTSRLQPIDVYGSTKLEAESLVKDLSVTNQLDSVIVRLFNVIGPGETNPHVAPAILAQIRRGARCLRLGNIHPRRDYVHIADAARGFETIALSANVGGVPVTVVNLGSGVSHSVRDLVAIFARALGEELTIKEDSARVRLSDRPTLTANLDKIARFYGWMPRLTAEDAIRDLCRNPDISEALLAKS
jgi:UDP-glucose 4-epimerase